jgi:hypothetical protein
LKSNQGILIPTVKHKGRFCDGLGSNIVIQYSIGPIVTFRGPVTAREYVKQLDNRVHPMIQTLFPNSVAVFQDDNALIHTAGLVQSWIEEHEGELQHLSCPAQSQDLN